MSTDVLQALLEGNEEHVVALPDGYFTSVQSGQRPFLRGQIVGVGEVDACHTGTSNAGHMTVVGGNGRQGLMGIWTKCCVSDAICLSQHR